MTETFKRGVLVCYLSLLVFLSLNPWVRPESGGDVSWDKIDHIIAYGGLTILIFLSGRKGQAWYAGSSLVMWAIAMVISFFIGAVLEVAQSLFTYNRVGSAADMAANTVGILLGYVVFMLARFVYSKWSHWANKIWQR